MSNKDPDEESKDINSKQTKMESEEFDLFKVKIDRNSHLAIDKTRRNRNTATSLFPATMQDSSEKPIDVVAKVTYIMNPLAWRRFRECAEINRLLHDHPAVVEVLGIHEIRDKNLFFLLLEKAEASLRDIIKPVSEEAKSLRKRLFDVISPRDIFHDLIQGLAYIQSKTDRHNNKISHRDIKPENILVVANKRDEKFTTKYTDFDSAKQLEETESVAITGGAFTPLYMDPYLTEKEQKHEKVTVENYLAHDVHALGQVAYELLGDGSHLYQGDTPFDTIFNMRKKNRCNLIDADIDELAKNAIWAMTQPDPADRITIEEAKQMPYFCSITDLVQLLIAVNEAIINLGRSEEAKVILKQLNGTFFMVYKTKWKSHSYVIPIILKRSKYDDSFVAWLRYVRNLIVHCGQRQELLVKVYGKPMTDVGLLEEVLKEAPRGLIHCLWISNCYFSELVFNVAFPAPCAKAYEDMIQVERERIGDSAAMAKLQQEIYPDKDDDCESDVPLESPTEVFLHQIAEYVKTSEASFKPLKSKMEKLERKSINLQEAIKKMREGKRSQEEVAKKEEELKSITEQLKGKWILNFRTALQLQEDIKKDLRDMDENKSHENDIKKKQAELDIAVKHLETRWFQDTPDLKTLRQFQETMDLNQTKLDKMQTELDMKQTELANKQQELEKLNETSTARIQELDMKQTELANKQQELEKLNETSTARTQELDMRQTMLDDMQADLENKEQQLEKASTTRTQELDMKQLRLDKMQAELEEKQAKLDAKHTELDVKKTERSEVSGGKSLRFRVQKKNLHRS